LTKFESIHQTISVFEHAGGTACRMLILKTDNPYPKTDKNGVPEPAFQAWERGWKSAADAGAIKVRPIKPYVKRAPFKRPTQPTQPARPGNYPRFVEAKANARTK
jgi:hypothetical protein